MVGSRTWIDALKRSARRLMGERLYIHTVSGVRRRWAHGVLVARRLISRGVPPAVPPDVLPALRKKWLSGDPVPKLGSGSPLRAHLERSGKDPDPKP